MPIFSSFTHTHIYTLIAAKIGYFSHFLFLHICIVRKRELWPCTLLKMSFFLNSVISWNKKKLIIFF